MLLIAACARRTGAKGLFDSHNFRSAEEAKTIADRVIQGPKRVPAVGGQQRSYKFPDCSHSNRMGAPPICGARFAKVFPQLVDSKND